MKYIVYLSVIISCCFSTSLAANGKSASPPDSKIPAASESLAVPLTLPPKIDTSAEVKPPIAPSYDSFEQAFNAGIEFYQKKNFSKALNAFNRSIEFQPANVAALTNLALAQFQVGEKGYAIALLRRALSISPDFSTPKVALDFILAQVQLKEIPHEIQIWEQLRSNLLNPLSLWSYLAITALFFLACGWLLLKYFGKRRRALKEDQAMPNLPGITVFVTFGFVCLFFLTGFKIIDHLTPRGTILLEKISVKSAPSDSSASIFDLYSGLEVILLRTDGDWIQVRYPGALTGWISKNSVMHTSGRKSW